MNINLDTFFDKIVAEVSSKDDAAIKMIRSKAEVEILNLTEAKKDRIDDALSEKIGLLIKSGIIKKEDGDKLVAKYGIDFHRFDKILREVSTITPSTVNRSMSC
jgi:hypothetical protein